MADQGFAPSGISCAGDNGGFSWTFSTGLVCGDGKLCVLHGNSDCMAIVETALANFWMCC